MVQLRWVVAALLRLGRLLQMEVFSSVPFGMNSKQMNSWIISGGGYKFYREIYEPFNLIPFVGGNTSMQMGGWFNRRYFPLMTMV